MNNYFDDTAKALFDDLVTESINFGGYDCYFIPREVDAIDKILNEIFLSNFKEAFKITVFREEVGGFFPNDFLIQKFGPEFSGSNTVFAVSKTDFKAITNMEFPAPGGLLVFANEKQIYEIKDVDTRDPWISGGKIYYWKLSCLPFSRGKNHRVFEDVFDYLDQDTGSVVDDFLEDTDLFSTDYFTADSTCVTADSTKHLASEYLVWDFFLPVTADRTDVLASDTDWTVDIDWSDRYQGTGTQDLIPIHYPEFQNGVFDRDAEKFTPKTDNTYGFS